MSNTDQQILPPTGFIRLPTVVLVTGAARSTIWEWVRKGTFPKQHKIGVRMSAWAVEDVRGWIAQQIEKGEAGRANPPTI